MIRRTSRRRPGGTICTLHVPRKAQRSVLGETTPLPCSSGDWRGCRRKLKVCYTVLWSPWALQKPFGLGVLLLVLSSWWGVRSHPSKGIFSILPRRSVWLPWDWTPAHHIHFVRATFMRIRQTALVCYLGEIHGSEGCWKVISINSASEVKLLMARYRRKHQTTCDVHMGISLRELW